MGDRARRAAETALVTAQVPEDDKEVSDAEIEHALHSIVFGKPPTIAAKVAALPFKVGDPAGFRQSGEPMLGASLGFTEGPKDVDPDNAQPHVVVGTGSSIRPRRRRGSRLPKRCSGV